MPRIDSGHSQRSRSARLGAPRAVVIAAMTATLFAVPGTARAAVPRVGVWESASRSEPRVAFDVRGPARARIVQRVSFPLTCRGSQSAVGWGATSRVRMRAGGQFTAYNFGSVIRGRFTATNRAEVIVRSDDGGDCRDTRRYLVVHRGRQVGVPAGRYLSLAGGGAEVGLETTAFGRMVDVEFMDGSMPADCADGSRRSVPLAGPDGYALTAPIALNGRFEITATASGSSITIGGSFDGGSVAAFVFLSIVLADGTHCTALPQPLVGALAFPLPTGVGEGAFSPSPPVIPIHPA